MTFKTILETIKPNTGKSREFLLEFKDGSTLQISSDFVEYDMTEGRIVFDNCIELDDWDNIILDGESFILTELKASELHSIREI